MAKNIKKAYIGESNYHWSNIGPEFDSEDSPNIENCVALIVIAGYLIILKVKWHKWHLVSSESKESENEALKYYRTKLKKKFD
jgi:hypothetical protein